MGTLGKDITRKIATSLCYQFLFLYHNNVCLFRCLHLFIISDLLSMKSLLFNKGVVWMKKDGMFDVIIRCVNTEVCELIGTFLLDKINEKYDRRNISVYCNDRLSAFKNKSSTQLNTQRIKRTCKNI